MWLQSLSGMSVIIRLQHLPWSASAADIRAFFTGMAIPEGGVHIVGGRDGDAFIAFASDEDARQAMRQDGRRIQDARIKLLLSSRLEMQRVIDRAKGDLLSPPAAASTSSASPPPVAVDSATAPTGVPPPALVTSFASFPAPADKAADPWAVAAPAASQSSLSAPAPWPAPLPAPAWDPKTGGFTFAASAGRKSDASLAAEILEREGNDDSPTVPAFKPVPAPTAAPSSVYEPPLAPRDPRREAFGAGASSYTPAGATPPSVPQGFGQVQSSSSTQHVFDRTPSNGFYPPQTAKDPSTAQWPSRLPAKRPLDNAYAQETPAQKQPFPSPAYSASSEGGFPGPPRPPALPGNGAKPFGAQAQRPLEPRAPLPKASFDYGHRPAADRAPGPNVTVTAASVFARQPEDGRPKLGGAYANEQRQQQLQQTPFADFASPAQFPSAPPVPPTFPPAQPFAQPPAPVERLSQTSLEPLERQTGVMEGRRSGVGAVCSRCRRPRPRRRPSRPRCPRPSSLPSTNQEARRHTRPVSFIAGTGNVIVVLASNGAQKTGLLNKMMFHIPYERILRLYRLIILQPARI